jgi:hypothetical protein
MAIREAKKRAGNPKKRFGKLRSHPDSENRAGTIKTALG